MNWLKPKPPTVLHVARLEEWAERRVGAKTGLKMIATQAFNEAIRRCRIGNVTCKPGARAE